MRTIQMVRKNIDIENSWRFTREEIAGFELLEFDDNGWESVNIPHDWAIKGPFDLENDKKVDIMNEDFGWDPCIWPGQTGAAIENILLKAVDLGLGGCWIGAFDKVKAHKIIEISEDLEVIYLVAFGYPGEEPILEDIKKNISTKYYLDENDILHVPKYAIDQIMQWR